MTKVHFGQTDVMRAEWQVRRLSDRAGKGAGDDAVDHRDAGNSGRQGGAATEQSTHSALTGLEGAVFKMYEMHKGGGWGGHVSAI